MMQLVNNNGTVLLKLEKPRAMRTNTLTLRAKRLSHGIKKTVRPVLMSKEEFFSNVINKVANGNNWWNRTDITYRPLSQTLNMEQCIGHM